MCNKLIILILFFMAAPLFVEAQSCGLTWRGYIKDTRTGLPLEAVTVYTPDLAKGVLTDSTGFFEISNMCAGEYEWVCSHIGCVSKRLLLHLRRDTVVYISMEYAANTLHDVVVIAKPMFTTTQHTETLRLKDITQGMNKNLANLLDGLAGVQVIRNGNTIAKPVVHGFYGNRLTIVNNGIAQSGQQWGNDHSPEIDPLAANNISVINGVGALEYAGGNMGGVVLVSPSSISRTPQINGTANYYFATNGLENGGHIKMQQYHPQLSWRINATLKKGGDKKTPTYWLNNTGNSEANIALQLKKEINDRIFSELYLSSFNTTLGILRGSHVGNLTDLEAAFLREIPFFTDSIFSYKIDAPKQQVSHWLLKSNTTYRISHHQEFSFIAAGQFNNRREFDVRRSGRSTVPALSLQQWTGFFHTKYQHIFSNHSVLRTGVQLNLINNTNQPETGVLPLIPDYLAYETGIYAWWSKQNDNSMLTLGARYDYIYRSIAAISKTTPRQVLFYTNRFHNLSASAGFQHHFSPNFILSYNMGYTTRSPSINELYSNGLHQGVSGIEEGNETLRPEHSFKTTLSATANIRNIFSIEALAYYQHINDYIYLYPQDEIRLTIRGAFPVFHYAQTDAQIYGIDIIAQTTLNPVLNSKITYSYLKGNDLQYDIPLVFMPTNSIAHLLSYQSKKEVALGKMILQNMGIAVENKYVFKQNHLLPSQDFIPPPNGYHLLSIKASASYPTNRNEWQWFITIDNALNAIYRDYFNRQRYFANELGINIIFGASFSF